MKIANVIYENELVNHTTVDYVNYHKGMVEFDKLDKSMPTLYVGWSFMKACNPENEIIQHADILKKKIITNELYWEFNFEESKASHVKGVDSFVNIVPQFYFTPKYTYVNLDPVFFQLSEVRDVMDVLPKKFDASYLFKDEMLYLLTENNITGINLKMYEFFQFNIEEIKEQIAERTSVSHIDLNGDTYQTQYKIFPNFTHLKRYMIAILTK